MNPRKPVDIVFFPQLHLLFSPIHHEDCITHRRRGPRRPSILQ
jgi:hypothetical protein